MSPAEFLARFDGLAEDGLPQLLTLRQVAILAVISEAEPKPSTVRAIAARLAIGKPAVTRALDTFAHHRLAMRTRNPKDGRDVLVSLTERGLAAVVKLFGPAPGQMVEDFRTPAERARDVVTSRARG